MTCQMIFPNLWEKFSAQLKLQREWVRACVRVCVRVCERERVCVEEQL